MGGRLPAMGGLEKRRPSAGGGRVPATGGLGGLEKTRPATATATATLWLGNNRLAFLRILPFCGSDLEIDPICLVFIEFFLSIGSSKMALVHGRFILGQRILYNFLVKIWIWFKIFVHGCDFGLTTAIILRLVWVFDVFC